MPSTPPFNDTTIVEVNYRQAHSVSGSDTSSTDQFRQGVELRDSFYFLGAVKIHSGFPQHELPQNKFGQARPALVDENWYYDLDTYGSDTFLLSNPLTDGALRSCESVFPKANRNLPQAFESSMDGVLEPIVIRARASFYGSEDYKESRNILGCLAEGNDSEYGNEQVVSVYDLLQNNENAAFSDSDDQIKLIGVVGNIVITGSTGATISDTLTFASASNISEGLYRIHLDRSFSSLKSSRFALITTGTLPPSSSFSVKLANNDVSNGRYVDFLILFSSASVQNQTKPSDSESTINVELLLKKESSVDSIRIRPWVDDPVFSSSNAFFTGSNQYIKMDREIRSAIFALTGTNRIDNYVPPMKKAMTSGFAFDTSAGTDSIAFGGYYYISSSVSRPPGA